MCWMTNNDVFLQEIVTKVDMPVFKICETTHIENTVISVYQDFCYKLNNVYTLEAPLKIYVPVVSWRCMYSEVFEGFHSYILDCEICHLAGEYPHNVIGLDGVNIGAYPEKCVKVLGYIPKGATYLINARGECVSTSICLTKIEFLH